MGRAVTERGQETPLDCHEKPLEACFEPHSTQGGVFTGEWWLGELCLPEISSDVLIF